MYRHSKVPESGLWVQGRYAISDSIRFCVAVVVPTCAEALYQKLREERLTGLTCMHAQWFKHFQTSLLSAAKIQQLAKADGWAAVVHETHGKRLVVASSALQPMIILARYLIPVLQAAQQLAFLIDAQSVCDRKSKLLTTW